MIARHVEKPFTGDAIRMLHRMGKIIWGGIGCGVTLFLLTSCNQKVTRENYNKLRVGMAYSEVTKLLGEPTACRALLQAKSCTWGEDPRVINIQFIGDKTGVFSSRGL